MSDIKGRLWLQDGKIISQRQQDVEPYLDANKAAQNAGAPSFAPTFRKVASIPNVVIEKWMAEEGAPVLSMNKAEFDRFIKRKLNDPNWKYLKTTTGRV